MTKVIYICMFAVLGFISGALNAAPKKAQGSNNKWLVTAYSDGFACNKHWGPYAAHGGKRLKWGMVAADWRVLKPGTKIHIEGYGTQVFTVMGKGSAIKGTHIDLYLPGASNKQMYRFGRKKLEVKILSQNDLRQLAQDAQKKNDNAS